MGYSGRPAKRRKRRASGISGMSDKGDHDTIHGYLGVLDLTPSELVLAEWKPSRAGRLMLGLRLPGISAAECNGAKCSGGRATSLDRMATDSAICRTLRLATHPWMAVGEYGTTGVKTRGQAVRNMLEAPGWVPIIKAC